MTDLPSADFLKQYIEFDPGSPSGIRWLAQSINKSNSNPGKAAGCKNKQGYFRLELLGKSYPCHRLVLIMNGVLPQPGCAEVDHIDRDPSNNSLSNLRWVSRSLNNKNKIVCGAVPFVYVHKRRQRFVARYKHPTTLASVQVGSYGDPYEAHCAALAHRLQNHWIAS
jgi:hypothetical protein